MLLRTAAKTAMGWLRPQLHSQSLSVVSEDERYGSSSSVMPLVLVDDGLPVIERGRESLSPE